MVWDITVAPHAEDVAGATGAAAASAARTGLTPFQFEVAVDLEMMRRIRTPSLNR